MFKKSHLSLAVSVAVGCGAFGVAPNALGQDVEVEEVFVTGSRIQRANLVSTSPVTQVGAQEIQEAGITRVEDLLNDLPQVAASNSSGDANGASGTATLNLRNLGVDRTLVLVNGRRLPSGSPVGGEGGGGSDLNQIPAALIERVELLTGGASSAYGSDAVAGVANFIMKDDFEGIQIGYQHSFYNHKNSNSSVQALNRANGFDVPTGSVTDGHSDDFHIIMGGNLDDGRGNITAYATYREIDAVKQESRDYSNCALNGDVTACGGSSTLPDGRFTDFGTAVNGNSFDYIVQGNEFVDRNGLLYNYAPANFYQRPDERFTGGLFAHYDINSKVQFYSELNFMDNQTNAQIAPSGAFFVTSTLPCGNPFLSDQQFNAICANDGLTAADTQNVYIGRRNVEGGFRNQDIRHTSFRGVFGLRGDINETWSYDMYYSYSEVSYESTYNNELSTTRITRALDAVTDADGNIVCRSALEGYDTACVPWNIFQTGGVTQDMIDYLQIPLFARGTTDQKVVSAYVTGDLGDYNIKLPTAENGVQVVLGLEYRKDNLDYKPDINYQSGDGAGQGGPTVAVAGGFDVEEIYGEVSIPLVEGRKYADELNMDLGYRYSDYSTGVDTDTYKVALGWAVNSDFKARASYQKAVRHPNVRDLYSPQSIGLYDMGSDPCAGANPSASFEQCARTGVTAAQYGSIADSPAGQYNGYFGGNPDLSPESSETVSYGFVWTPDYISGLTATVDYYNIEITDAISTISPETTLTQCLETGADQFCSLIHRGAGSGTLWLGDDNIVATNINIGFIQTEGVDFVLRYEFDLADMGSISITNNGNYVIAYEQEEYPGAGVESCEGTWGGSCGAPTPDFKNNLGVTWNTPWNLSLSSALRHIGKVEANSASQVGFSSRTYWDLSANYDVNDDMSFRLGVQNVTDKAPPLSNPGPSIYGNGNTFPGTYDALGRYIYLGASVRF